MANPELIKNIARQRASELKLPYSGALLPEEAYSLMLAGAKLVDIRTKAELEWVGRVPGALAVEWNSWPGSVPNPGFVAQLEALASKDVPVMFLCRSGGRSHNAAIAAAHAGVSANDLTDETFIDELCGNAALNGVAVRIERRAAP